MGVILVMYHQGRALRTGKELREVKSGMSRCVPGERSGENISDRGNRQRHKV